jgi:transcriptional regulator with XRE-family HTH domain
LVNETWLIEFTHQKRLTMPLSFKRLRSKLAITQDDLAFYLGVNRSMVAHLEGGRAFESGRIRERLDQLMVCLKQAERKQLKEFVDYNKAIRNDAEQWLTKQRAFAAARAEYLANKLHVMKAEYADCSKAMQNLQAILDDPFAAEEVKDLVRIVQPKLIKKIKKIDPKVQAKLILRRDEAAGVAGVQAMK